MIRGRVQGVGFRWFAEHAARQEGLHGWVENRADGQVEIRAEGEADALVRFERHIRRGPSRARVDDVMVEDVTASGRTSGFLIR